MGKRPAFSKEMKVEKPRLVFVIIDKNWCIENIAKSIAARLKDIFDITISYFEQEIAALEEADIIWAFHGLGVRGLEHRFWNKTIYHAGSMRQFYKFGGFEKEIKGVLGVTCECEEIRKFVKNKAKAQDIGISGR